MISEILPSKFSSAYGDPSLEDDRFMPRALAVGKSADSLSALVLISKEEIVQAVVAKGLKEPFAVEPTSVSLA